MLTPLEFTLITFAVALVAGLLGSLLGIGGAVIVTPVLTLLLGIDIRYAIGASLITVIATSSGAAAAYVRERMTNLRVAMLLEIGTTTGALTGAYLAGHIPTRWLFVIFGILLAYSGIMMLRRRHEEHSAVPPDPFADQLRLHGSYFDQATKKEVTYRVTRSRLGILMMYGAGIVSGLLGVGSGVLKVPAMDLAMRLPIKVSTATSNFMMGVTAAASAGVYFSRGDINPYIAGPVAMGVLVGATLGSKLMGRIHSHWIRRIFVAIMILVSIQMMWKGIKGII